MRAEALTMIRVLGAAAEQFFDVMGTPGIEHELQLLCRPERRSVWPGAFDGAEAAVEEAVSLLARDADGLRRAAGAVLDVMGTPGSDRS
ncbi:hypothetical protein [Actinacidiphila yeochonensis]|uniref:hypothetical protein n=1 Tax=Actinacidiphila yeochonensis TaxID=89050 RepID=UPI0018E3BDF5|nr:hypothetical protein [Actinacidiphila yeochonensis]